MIGVVWDLSVLVDKILKDLAVENDFSSHDSFCLLILKIQRLNY